MSQILNPTRKLGKEFSEQLAETFPGDHTHVCMSHLTTNQSDRVMFSVGPSTLSNKSNNAVVVVAPMELYSKGISDHTAVFWSIR